MLLRTDGPRKSALGMMGFELVLPMELSSTRPYRLFCGSFIALDWSFFLLAIMGSSENSFMFPASIGSLCFMGLPFSSSSYTLLRLYALRSPECLIDLSFSLL